MAKQRATLGNISLVFAGLVIVLFTLHFANVVLVLGTMIPPLVALFGSLLGIMGYFERDKQKVQAFIGMLVNAALLITWTVLFIVSLTT